MNLMPQSGRRPLPARLGFAVMAGADGVIPEALLVGLKAAGYTGIEPNCYQPQQVERIAAGCRSAGLAIHALPTGRWLDVTEALDDYARYTQKAFAVLRAGAAIAVALDVPLIFGLIRGPGPIPRTQAEEFLTSVIPQLIQATPDLRILVEPIASDEAAWPHTLADGTRLLETLNLPQVKLLADSYHIARSGEDPRIERYRDSIGHLHIRDSTKQIPSHSLPEYVPIYAAILRLWREADLVLSFEPNIDLSQTLAHALAGAEWIDRALAQS